MVYNCENIFVYILLNGDLSNTRASCAFPDIATHTSRNLNYLYHYIS